MKNVKHPRIHLSLDNCFAIKRWVRPRDWMKFAAEIGGIHNMQASTDNEIDPLFNTQDFRDEWVEEVKKYEKEYGLKIQSFYSGYATYRTAGIAHYNKSSQQKLIDAYFKPIVDVAKKLDAQVGNTLGAYAIPVLKDSVLYQSTECEVNKNLGSMAAYANAKEVLFSYEQMYTPGQGMWTIDGCRDTMRKIYADNKNIMYITIDTAHQVGQNRFLYPDESEINEMIVDHSTKGRMLGNKAEAMIQKGGYSAAEILEVLKQYGHLFAKPADSDVYSWFSELGCYSPIVHLQQTDGTYSAHKPFTPAYNENGIIEPKKVLQAIAKSYEKEDKGDLPPKVEDIYLAFEIFFGVTENEYGIQKDLKQSIDFWRKAIPKDGMPLNELI